MILTPIQVHATWSLGSEIQGWQRPPGQAGCTSTPSACRRLATDWNVYANLQLISIFFERSIWGDVFVWRCCQHEESLELLELLNFLLSWFFVDIFEFLTLNNEIHDPTGRGRYVCNAFWGQLLVLPAEDGQYCFGQKLVDMVNWCGPHDAFTLGVIWYSKTWQWVKIDGIYSCSSTQIGYYMVL